MDIRSVYNFSPSEYNFHLWDIISEFIFQFSENDFSFKKKSEYIPIHIIYLLESSKFFKLSIFIIKKVPNATKNILKNNNVNKFLRYLTNGLFK